MRHCVSGDVAQPLEAVQQLSVLEIDVERDR